MACTVHQHDDDDDERAYLRARAWRGGGGMNLKKRKNATTMPPSSSFRPPSPGSTSVRGRCDFDAVSPGAQIDAIPSKGLAGGGRGPDADRVYVLRAGWDRVGELLCFL